jgi:3-hydroxybutyryl-CoA dehydrogenase
MMKLDDIRKTAIIGAGTMGAGIGLCFAQAGLDVMLFDIMVEQLNAAMERIKNSQEALIREAVITDAAAVEALRRVGLATDLKTALEGVQFVLEAVPEDLDLKHRVFKEVECLCSPDTILATNTSGLSITNIASACDHPERIVGFHWVNPPELVPLVEVIRGENTSSETANLIYALAEKLGKKPVMIRREAPGIGLNRLQFAVLREAFHMVETGVVSPDDLDRIMKYGLGFRYSWLGPLETADLGGLDVFHSIAGYLFKELSAAQGPPESLNRLVENNHLGIKTGRGFYEYEEGSRDEILRRRDLYFVRQWKLIQAMRREEGRD